MKKKRKIWIFAGESSGDMYGAQLGEEMRRIAAAKGEELELSGMGGKAMIAAGIPVKVDSTELGVMGVVEVSKLIFKFIAIYISMVKAARKERPDTVVLIDYPGFNLLYALAMYFSGIKVVWYIAPHLWIWGKWRLPVLAKICTKVLVIFPFEVEVFSKTKLKAVFTGHPLIDIMAEKKDPSIVRDPDLVLLLPGSRAGEISRMLPHILDSVQELKKRHPHLKFRLSAPREKIAVQCREIIEKFRRKKGELPEIQISVGDTNCCQQLAGTGIAACGTVTVESAIMGLPLLVGYQLGFINYLFMLPTVRPFRGFITMTNIIDNTPVCPEFIQYDFKKSNIVPAFETILPGGSRRESTLAGMERVTKMLSDGNNGRSAVARAAEEIYSTE
ncbi:MAG: lipid-A-disaccharide synthase [Lentisphaeria bacterium]|nr:lipid-A-disaccharide synthase [Lentisphaeria bacterium]